MIKYIIHSSPPVKPFLAQGQGKKMNTRTQLKQVALFSDIKDSRLKIIAQDVVKRPFRRDEFIFHEGDPGQELYLIQSGSIRVFVNGLDGSETSIILFGRPGDIFGELAVIDGLPRSATAVAMVDTVLLIMSRTQFRYHMRQCPQLGLNFMQELSRKVRYNTRQVDALSSLPIPQRLARKIIELSQDYGRVQKQGVLIDMLLIQANLASLIGATRESTNRSLRKFQKHGWILYKKGFITVLDPDALHEQNRS